MQGRRPDGREMQQLRPVSVGLAVCTASDGSARVQLGGWVEWVLQMGYLLPPTADSQGTPLSWAPCLDRDRRDPPRRNSLIAPLCLSQSRLAPRLAKEVCLHGCGGRLRCCDLCLWPFAADLRAIEMQLAEGKWQQSCGCRWHLHRTLSFSFACSADSCCSHGSTPPLSNIGHVSSRERRRIPASGPHLLCLPLLCRCRHST